MGSKDQQHPEDADLRTALDAAYAEFSAYPQPRALNGATTRNPQAILKALAAYPLRQLPAGHIGPYAGWALTTVGSVSDYRHFLPRILEVASETQDWLGTIPPVIAGKLQHASWKRWPRGEQKAILTVFEAAFAAALRGDCEEPEIWLCGLATLAQPVESILS